MSDTEWAIKTGLYGRDAEELAKLMQRLGIDVKEGLDKTSCLVALESFMHECRDDKVKGERKLQLFLTAMGSETTMPSTTPPAPATVVRVTDNKELKISGTISKNGITFCSLIRQIEAAEKRGYSTSEIIEAICRAIPTTEPLRGYIEGNTGLNLAVLRKLLRTFYEEKSATELYQDLSSGVQSPKEETLDFVWQMLDLGQKINFSCKEEGADLVYDQNLVRSMTLRTLLTGLRDLSIAQELKSVLTSHPEDHEIVCVAGAAVSAVKERKRKNTQIAGVKLVETEAKDTIGADSTVELLQALRAEVASLKQHQQQQQQQRTNWNPRPRLCVRCKGKGKSSCDHCFRCGSSEHFQAGCRQRRNRSDHSDSGNSNESAMLGSH